MPGTHPPIFWLGDVNRNIPPNIITYFRYSRPILVAQTLPTESPKGVRCGEGCSPPAFHPIRWFVPPNLELALTPLDVARCINCRAFRCSCRQANHHIRWRPEHAQAGYLRLSASDWAAETVPGLWRTVRPRETLLERDSCEFVLLGFHAIIVVVLLLWRDSSSDVIATLLSIAACCCRCGCYDIAGGSVVYCKQRVQKARAQIAPTGTDGRSATHKTRWVRIGEICVCRKVHDTGTYDTRGRPVQRLYSIFARAQFWLHDRQLNLVHGAKSNRKSMYTDHHLFPACVIMFMVILCLYVCV